MRVYGPIPSRRFGLSLGIDIVPHKTCQLDCIYCQLGPTEETTVTPSCFFPIDDIIRDVQEALREGPAPDVITLAGSGEPTLYTGLETLITRLKEVSDAPVLLITNGVMLRDPMVEKAAMLADILAPSLDAGDAQTFARINRPHPDIRFEDVVQGLRDVTHAHPGEVRLEIMLIAGVNDTEAQLQALHEIVKTLRVDRIDLNTPVRPPIPERGALPCDATVLERAKAIFGEKAHAIGAFVSRQADSAGRSAKDFLDIDKDVLEVLKRRPCTLNDISEGLRITRSQATDALIRLQQAGLVRISDVGEAAYYHATQPR